HTGDAVLVAERLGLYLATAHALSSVSETGVLVYRSQSREDSQLVWFDRASRQRATVGPAGTFAVIRLSPDQKRVALQRVDDEKGTHDIWLIEVTRGTPTRLTVDPANHVYPTFS